MGYTLPHGVHDRLHCPHCGDEPLVCAHGHCDTCGYKIKVEVDG